MVNVLEGTPPIHGRNPYIDFQGSDAWITPSHANESVEPSHAGMINARPLYGHHFPSSGDTL
jgi:hypothetical protein